MYQGNDFCEIEGFPNKIENMPQNVVYIWEVVTRKEFMGRGIAKKLLAYVLDKFNNYTIYSCINVNICHPFAYMKSMVLKNCIDLRKKEITK